MLILTCPNCGARSVAEFRYGGEYNPRPPEPEQVSEETWVEYLYVSDNRMGRQTEWWYHSAGCGLWFLAERHTRTNRVERTFLWQPQTDSGERQGEQQPE